MELTVILSQLFYAPMSFALLESIRQAAVEARDNLDILVAEKASVSTLEAQIASLQARLAVHTDAVAKCELNKNVFAERISRLAAVIMDSK